MSQFFSHSFNLLNAVSTTGAGPVVSTSGAGNYSFQVKSTGAPTGLIVTLQGSNNDGRNWFTIGTWTLASQAEGDIIFVTQKPVQEIRANLTTLSGGTSPTVSCWGAASR